MYNLMHLARPVESRDRSTRSRHEWTRLCFRAYSHVAHGHVHQTRTKRSCGQIATPGWYKCAHGTSLTILELEPGLSSAAEVRHEEKTHTEKLEKQGRTTTMAMIPG